MSLFNRDVCSIVTKDFVQVIFDNDIIVFVFHPSIHNANYNGMAKTDMIQHKIEDIRD